MILCLLIYVVTCQIHINLKHRTINNKHLRSDVNLSNFLNMQYTGTMKIGDQELEILFDTGSSVFWTFSNGCQTCDAPKRTLFDCQSSTNCLMTKEEYKVLYGQGQVEGYKTYDSVQISNLTLSNYQFLLVNQQSQLNNLKADGICGLGLQSVEGFKSIIDVLYDQRLIEKRIFTFFLNSIPQQINNNSVLFIGGFDNHYMNSEIKYVNLVSNDQWMIKLQQVTMDNKELISNNKALIDTGSSLIVLPTHHFSQLLSILRDHYQQFCQYSQYQIKCSCPEGDISHFPTFNFDFGNGLILQIKPNDYITTVVSVCVLAFTKSSNEFWILGDTFIRTQVTLFDMDEKRIGFAKQATFEQLSKQIQINDYLYVFKVVCVCICGAIGMIWIIRKISCL